MSRRKVERRQVKCQKTCRFSVYNMACWTCISKMQQQQQQLSMKSIPFYLLMNACFKYDFSSAYSTYYIYSICAFALKRVSGNDSLAYWLRRHVDRVNCDQKWKFKLCMPFQLVSWFDSNSIISINVNHLHQVDIGDEVGEEKPEHEALFHTQLCGLHCLHSINHVSYAKARNSKWKLWQIAWAVFQIAYRLSSRLEARTESLRSTRCCGQTETQAEASKICCDSIPILVPILHCQSLVKNWVMLIDIELLTSIA